MTDDLFNLLDSENSYVGKINQNNISIPTSYAAIGQEAYTDIYNFSTNKGYEITGTSIPGVIDSHMPISRSKTDKNSIQNYVEQYAQEFGIPLNLARAVVRQESGGNPKAKSKAGAMGVMQLMPATAKSLGVTNPYDPAQNIWGGMKYLAQQYKQFGNWAHALAAYNAGPGNVRKHKGIPPFIETQNYVKNIMAMAKMNWSDATYPITHSFASEKNIKKFINTDTGMLSIKGLNDFVYDINNANCYKGKVDQIVTNRPELLENKEEYADYKKFREMKTADGRPLFVKGTFDGFKVMIKKDDKVKNGQLNYNAIEAMSEDVLNSQTNVLPENSKSKIQALLSSFGDRYNGADTDYAENKTFGLANLTSEEYENYGIPINIQQNPLLQARVLNQEFQRAIDLLGSEGKAVYALAGGDMEDDKGNLLSWKEIKTDREAYLKKWIVKPSKDKRKRNQINQIVARYNSTLNLLGGA